MTAALQHARRRWQGVRRQASLSFSAAGSAMKLLADAGIAGEVTGRKRNRVFGYTQYVAILVEGTER